MFVGAAFVFSVAVTAGSVAGEGTVGYDGATDGPLGDIRAEVAVAPDVGVISTRCNMNESAHASWR